MSVSTASRKPHKPSKKLQGIITNVVNFGTKFGTAVLEALEQIIVKGSWLSVYDSKYETFH